MFDRGVPSICYGLRGLAYFQIDRAWHEERPALGRVRRRRGQSRDGAGAGPGADEGSRAAGSRSRVLRRRRGARGRGTARDRQAAVQREEVPARSSARRSCLGETGYTTLERTWARPTFEVNGLLSGFTGEGAKTVFPAVAMAKVSMRLVPNQDPDEDRDAVRGIRRRKVRAEDRRVTVTRMHGGKPWMTQFDNPFVQAAGRAIEQGLRQRPVFCREGGSIPVVSTFQEELGRAVRALRRRSSRRERARARRTARSRQLPQRHCRLGVSLRGDRRLVDL